MAKYNYLLPILCIFAVILFMFRGPVFIHLFATNAAADITTGNKAPSLRGSNVINNEGQNKENILDREYKPGQPPKPRRTDPIESIRRDCGELCNTSRVGFPGEHLDYVIAPVDCPALFRNNFIDRTHTGKHAPREIPKELMNDFTMNGRLKVSAWYFDQPYLGGKALAPVWTKDKVENMLSSAKKGKLYGNYGYSETNALRDGLQNAPGVKNGRVLVIGSENPWAEACVLEAGANEVVTLEYGEIKSEHPQIKTMTPLQFRNEYLNDTLGKFDAVVTFSSVEHSGLGRYGDALNPWGDIIAVARAWCVTKIGGSLTIGVMYAYNNDHIRFNAGRWYGKIRFPYLATNWKLLYKGKGGQRVHVFVNEGGIRQGTTSISTKNK